MEYEFGRLVISKRGHDKGKVYIIIKSDEEYVYLSDGRLKKKNNLKKKNKKHIQITNFVSELLIEKNKSDKLIDEDIKRVIKLYIAERNI